MNSEVTKSLLPTAEQQEQLADIRKGLRQGSAAARAVAALKKHEGEWPAETFISSLRTADKKLYDSAYNSFKEAAKKVGMERVRVACALAGIFVPPGMKRSTSLNDDLEQMRQIYAREGKLTEKVIRGADQQLFNRVKKRAGKELSQKLGEDVKSSWKAAIYLLAELDSGVDVRNCFEHLPDGVYPDLPFMESCHWEWGDLSTPDKRRPVLVGLLRRLWEADLVMNDFAPDRFAKLSNGAESLLGRVHNDAFRSGQAWNWGVLVEEATGEPYEANAGGRQSSASHQTRAHERCLSPTLDGKPVPHKKLRSAEEAAVDGLLALLLGPDEYEPIHSHDVTLQDLGIGEWGELDIVIRGPKGVGVVEVSNGQPDDDYRQRLAHKLDCCRRAEIPSVNIDGVKAGSAYHAEQEKLVSLLQRLGLKPKLSLPEARNALARTAGAVSQFPSYEEASRSAREDGIDGSEAYKQRAANLGLPSNPNITYKNAGWTNWSDFLGMHLPPGRRKKRSS